MPALTESEARARAALLTIDSYDVSIDLTATPARSRTVIRFGCARPGAASFADLAAQVRGGAAVLNGAPLGPVIDGRLALAGLAAENVLAVEAEVSDRCLNRFAQPSGGGDYVRGYAYPTGAPDLFCCFDQLDLPAPLSLSVRVPGGWSCVANGAVANRPAPGAEGPLAVRADTAEAAGVRLLRGPAPRRRAGPRGRTEAHRAAVLPGRRGDAD